VFGPAFGCDLGLPGGFERGLEAPIALFELADLFRRGVVRHLQRHGAGL
jgi:hypothetical protein